MGAAILNNLIRYLNLKGQIKTSFWQEYAVDMNNFAAYLVKEHIYMYVSIKYFYTCNLLRVLI